MCHRPKRASILYQPYSIYPSIQRERYGHNDLVSVRRVLLSHFPNYAGAGQRGAAGIGHRDVWPENTAARVAVCNRRAVNPPIMPILPIPPYVESVTYTF